MPDNMEDLKRRFHKDMIYICKETYKRTKKRYNPTRFLSMVAEYGGYEAVKRIVSKEDIDSGLFNLVQDECLDLSIENYVVSKDYSCLFTDSEVARCEHRLDELHFDYSKREVAHG